jgi:hypothetical protein
MPCGSFDHQIEGLLDPLPASVGRSVEPDTLLGCHFDGLIVRLNMKQEVERDGTADANGRRFGCRRCESVGLDGNLIGTWIHLGRKKVAAGIGCAGTSGLRVYVCSVSVLISFQLPTIRCGFS